MTFTDDQKNAIEKFREFLKSDNQVFVLNGYAGTGKTTLLRHIIEHELDDRMARLMAPTGRAAMILGRKCGCEASTIHRSIYKIEKGPQLNLKKLRFELLQNSDPLSAIYFVDEASMISDLNQENELFKFGSGNLFKDLLEYVDGRKLVFVGDSAQLPPVGQNYSPALDISLLTGRYSLSVMSATMTEVVRQGVDSGVLKNSIELRRGIEAEDFSTFVLKTDDDVRTSSSLLDDYASVTNNSVDRGSIVVVESNKLALYYNAEIRKKIFQSSQRLVPGDLVVVSRNNYYQNVELFNGMILRVADCGDDSMVERRNVRYYSTDKEADGKAIVHELELGFRNATLEFEDGALCECKIFDPFIDDANPAPDPELRQALLADFNNRHPELKRSDAEYFDSLRRDPYVNAVICKYGYAITCHKAQGGEWDRVFVDMDMMKGKQSKDFFRWSYTAVTRSAKQLWVANAPHFDFLSEMTIAPISKMNANGMAFFCPDAIDFLDYRAGRIKTMCEDSGLNFHEDRGKEYQHNLHLSDGKGGNCEVQMWFNKSGYSGVDKIVSSSNEDLRKIVEMICRQSLIPDREFYRPSCDRASKLYAVVSSLASQFGLSIINVKENQYMDRYYFVHGEDYVCIDFRYNSKGNYTGCSPRSTKGVNDKALEALCGALL